MVHECWTAAYCCDSIAPDAAVIVVVLAGEGLGLSAFHHGGRSTVDVSSMSDHVLLHVPIMLIVVSKLGIALRFWVIKTVFETLVVWIRHNGRVERRRIKSCAHLMREPLFVKVFGLSGSPTELITIINLTSSLLLHEKHTG